jgi:F-type H+-transporting ATPase subunit epsilon
MAGTFKFELVTPAKMLIPERGEDPKSQAVAEAEQVIVPGMDGQFTVLAGHAPLITSLRPGVLDIKLASGRRRVFVRGGVAEVMPDRLTILAQQLVDLDKADAGQIQAEKAAAEAMLGEAKTDDERMMAKSAIAELETVAR